MVSIHGEHTRLAVGADARHRASSVWPGRNVARWRATVRWTRASTAAREARALPDLHPHRATFDLLAFTAIFYAPALGSLFSEVESLLLYAGFI